MSASTMLYGTISIKDYRRLKLKMLREEFKVGVTCAEEEHLNTLQSEIAIDNYCRKILRNHWED